MVSRKCKKRVRRCWRKTKRACRKIFTCNGKLQKAYRKTKKFLTIWCCDWPCCKWCNICDACKRCICFFNCCKRRPRKRRVQEARYIRTNSNYSREVFIIRTLSKRDKLSDRKTKSESNIDDIKGGKENKPTEKRNVETQSNI